MQVTLRPEFSEMFRPYFIIAVNLEDPFGWLHRNPVLLKNGRAVA
jgi:hypothetical protein